MYDPSKVGRFPLGRVLGSPIPLLILAYSLGNRRIREN